MHRHRLQPAARWLLALLCAVLAAGSWACDSAPASRADVTPPPPLPRLVRQASGGDLLQLGAQVPGLTTVEVRQNVVLPGVLETNGHVDFDDKRVASISSRVAGRIENVRVSQWDNVRRGEQIIALYSPDFMTAEAEYLQAQTTAKLMTRAGRRRYGSDFGPAMVAAARRKLEFLGMGDADIAAIKAPDPTVWMRAPISGTVVENKALRGAAVNPGDVLLLARHAQRRMDQPATSTRMISRACT